MNGNFCAERKEACDNRLDDLRKLMWALFGEREKSINQLRSEQEKALTLARTEMDKDVTLARTELGRWMEEHNNFKAQLREQATTLMDIKTYGADHKVVIKEIETLREWKAKSEGERSRTVIISWIAVIISFLGVIFSAIRAFI